MSFSVDIKKYFKDFTLDMQFSSDKMPLGILGSSGSGKSMTLKCIAGIETPDEGYIEVNGQMLFNSAKKINMKPQKRNIGYLFQNYALFPNMTVNQNIECAITGSKAEKREKIMALLHSFELTGFGERYPSQLSGGQQQRVALARILAYEPDVLLLDEPFSALDSHLKEALQIDMLKLLDNYHGDIIMVTHSRDEVYKLCSDLMILDTGRVQAIGDSRDMFKNPKNIIAARLTGCKNFSRAQRLSKNTVWAQDWGCEFETDGMVTDSLTHIGIRAHYFTPCDKDTTNAVKVKICKRIESPFEWNVLFQNAKSEIGNEKIWWKYSKESNSIENPEYLCVSPKNILLLES